MDPLSSWDAVAAFRPLMAATKAHGSLVIGQVTHAGRVRGHVARQWMTA
jgi:2,4-dienoyl-CoA reductase-like NADH-dependent reductase (Old Yellow Enzyme family)